VIRSNSIKFEAPVTDVNEQLSKRIDDARKQMLVPIDRQSMFAGPIRRCGIELIFEAPIPTIPSPMKTEPPMRLRLATIDRLEESIYPPPIPAPFDPAAMKLPF
jgi:hypothetical protein